MLHRFQVVPPPIIRSSKLYTQHQVFVEFFLLLTAIVDELEQLTHDRGKKQIKFNKYPMLCSNSPTIAARSRKSSTNTRFCVYSFELLMMGRGTA
jgi:hypothetical protein